MGSAAGSAYDAATPARGGSRESWHPAENLRIPVRQHEPLGRQAIHFHHITAGWLRRAAQWHGKVALETGLLRWSTLAA